MAVNPAQPAAVSGPEINLEKEVRFAVVMYGGLSLAIYINGVAQELLSMVRATAPTIDDRHKALPASGDPALRGNERVYRKVSYLLANKEERLKVAEKKSTETDKDFTARLQGLQQQWLDAAEKALTGEPESDDTIRTRFIVDIISGTSAGGINGVFLAKALANGQDIDRLKQLWIDQGDIALLINDKRSVEQPFALQRPPKSLFNSQRMYVQLLSALNGMEKKAASDNGQVGKLAKSSPAAERQAAAGNGQADPTDQSPYVDELDLFITTTDIQGLTLPIRLTDKVVYERRYRNVFRFIYSKEDKKKVRNDFQQKHNRFLAYAARCTSSFPFAFEPMCLRDIDPVAAHLDDDKDFTGLPSDNPEWERFFQDYTATKIKFEGRAFSDGGALDNKPFGYAIEALSRRTAEVTVERKLIYIEPSPEHLDQISDVEGKPNFAENALTALFTLPRYETIREDLQRVRERNHLIRRLNRIVHDVERDMDKNTLDDNWTKIVEDQDWAKKDMADMLQERGPNYIGYHRLEIATVTDHLAELIAHLVGIATDSDYSKAIRALVRVWRNEHFSEYQEAGKQTYNEFLTSYNLAYLQRRLRFLLRKIDQLYPLNEQAKDILHRRGKRSFDDLREDEKPQLRCELLDIKKRVNAALVKLRIGGRRLRSRHDENDLRDMIQKMNISEDDLKWILGSTPDDEAASRGVTPSSDDQQASDACEIRAELFLNSPEQKDTKEKLRKVGEALGNEIRALRDKAGNHCCKLFDVPDAPAPDEDLAVAMHRCLSHYYHHFDYYDAVLFPMTYGTDIGESALVEITRISPEDATNLINEKKDGEECLKLAGTALGHFGAFMEESWRHNDILWGRLDGAERLIAALLPDEPGLAKRLAGEAQAAIVCETIERKGQEEYYGLLVESLMRIKTGRPAPETLSSFIDALRKDAAEADVKKLKDHINDKAIRDYYLEHYPKRSQLQPEPALRVAARTTTVVGQMLEDLSDKYNHGKKATTWVTRLGRVFWGMVEVAVPQSIFNKVFRHWLKLFYLFEVLLIIGGSLFGNAEVSRFGWAALGLTALLHAAVTLLSDIMQYRQQRWRLAKVALIIVFLLFIGLGFLELQQVITQLKDYWERPRTFEITHHALLQIGGLLAFLWLAIATWMGIYFSGRMKKVIDQQHRANRLITKQEAQPKTRRPQFMPWMKARTMEEIKQLIGSRGDDRREVMAESTKADFFFIAIYSLLFLVMSMILYVSAAQSHRAFPFTGMPYTKLALVLSLAAAGAGLMAAVADIVENRRILTLLGMCLSEPVEKQAAKIRPASILKVAATCLTVTLLAFAFLCRAGNDSWSDRFLWLIGGLLIASALVTASGLFRGWHQVLGIGFLLMAVSLLIVMVMFIFLPHWLFADWFLSTAIKAAPALLLR